MSIKKISKDNILYVEVQFGSIKEYHITLSFEDDNDIEQPIDRLNSFIESNGIRVCFGFGFGNIEYRKKLDLLLHTGIDNKFPLTWVDGTYNRSDRFDGVYLMGVQGVETNYIYDKSNCIGRFYEDDNAQYTYLGNVGLHDNKLPEKEQAYENFKMIEKGLSKNGMEMPDIIRTWFYNRNILDWYAEFNAARTNFYKERKVYNNLIPASTGICGANPFNTALISSAIALKPKNDMITISEVDSPLQSTAVSYGSTFSRAVVVKLNGISKLTISGTASIDNSGNTVYKKDIGKQLEQTVNSIDAILSECNMTIQDSVRIFVYVKKAEDIEYVKKELTNKWGKGLPIILTWTTICRDDLLCEIELDAVSEN